MPTIDPLRRLVGEERAVSPVIGVAILIGITVVLGSIVGAFVFHVTEPGETAPDPKIRFDQESVNFETNGTTAAGGWSQDRPASQAELPVVEISHYGGDAVDNGKLVVQVTGNRTSGYVDNRSVYDVEYQGDADHDFWNTTVGPRDEKFVTGEEMRVVFYGTPEDDLAGKQIVQYDTNDYQIELEDFDTNDVAQARNLESGDVIEVLWETPGSREGKRLAAPFEVA